MTYKYGFFDTRFNAADAVAGLTEPTQLVASGVGLFWVEQRPEESGRSVLCWWQRDAGLRDLTPQAFSVRSRVYEYGGRSFCLLAPESAAEHDSSEDQVPTHVAFVNADDQQIWLQSLAAADLLPRQLTREETCRYGDLLYDSRRQRIIAVQEKQTTDPTQPMHALVAVCTKTAAVSYLSSGQDFYASACLDKTADRLAWISWNHPDMPWVKTRLHIAGFDKVGQLKREAILEPAGHGGDCSPESIQQPRFNSDGSITAVSDSSGWWNLYTWRPKNTETSVDQDAGKVCTKEALWPETAEFGVAQWQFGVSTWSWLTKTASGRDEEPRLVASYIKNAKGYLAMRHIDRDPAVNHSEIQLATEFSLFRDITCYKDKIYCVANSATRTPAILEIAPDFKASSKIRILWGHRLINKLERVSQPTAITYPVAENEVAYGFLYLPATIADSDSRPPLLVFTHGGPTATTYPVLNPRVQYWTERGFAVVDLNYRGSAGFGRDYRLRLAGQWGFTDVEDVVAAADYLAEKGLVDSHNVFIRGGSAGGYTTLCALAFSDRFRAGASYYGVSDPMSLTKDTHKFESHYLDWLIGDPACDLNLYQARSPLQAADRISCPMIFFQGGQDKIVLKDQTERMVEAMRSHGVSVEYYLYPQEQHGFRRSENLIHSMEAELAFYQFWLNK